MGLDGWAGLALWRASLPTGEYVLTSGGEGPAPGLHRAGDLAAMADRMWAGRLLYSLGWRRREPG